MRDLFAPQIPRDADSYETEHGLRPFVPIGLPILLQTARLAVAIELKSLADTLAGGRYAPEILTCLRRVEQRLERLKQPA